MTTRLLGIARSERSLDPIVRAIQQIIQFVNGLGSAINYNAGTGANNLLELDGSGRVPASVLFPNFIGGLALANDVSSSGTVLDIAAGACADATNAVTIALGAFTKSTGGVWAAGAGANGMGQGLTIAAGKWYHVFAITIPAPPTSISIPMPAPPTSPPTPPRSGASEASGPTAQPTSSPLFSRATPSSGACRSAM
jgi:hypothetical protein